MEQFAVTDRAAARIAEIVAESKAAQDTALRIAVLAGGCSGFQYKFELDDQTQPDDLVIEQGPARVVVDAVSL
ncbi:MAG TPA: iron-sulfur cluster assembly accessory protein, partial [Rhodopila sp.]|uniref:HesB/IscA family protein n=1 Tax=Rhodopila sp. TaxID=2480087 RepID=UPI002BA6A3AB